MLAKLRFVVSPWMPFLALRLSGRNPRTSEVQQMPVDGYGLNWTVTFPSSGDDLRTLFSDVPLELDQHTGFYVYRLDQDKLREVLQAREPLPLLITVSTPAGSVVPWATGCVSGEQLP